MIPVVMAADKNYFFPLMTSIASILENKSVDTDMEFYLFIDSEYTQQDRCRIDELLSSKGVSPAHYLNASQEYANAQMHIEHITAATYYRLKIPSSLPNLEKCIYLDVDTLVRTDLSAIYDKPMGDSYIMGVLAAGYQMSDAGKVAKAKELGVPHIDNYVNAGVLVFNLSRIRKDNLEARFDQLFNEGFPDQDQDILNAACFGAVKILPPEFNAMTKYEFEDDFYETDLSIARCWSKWEWDKARKNPLIVHFADIDKPWSNFAVPFAREWWHYARIAGVDRDSFDYYFDMHAANEVKIHKLKMEMWQTGAERDKAVNEKMKAQSDSAAMSAEKKNFEQKLLSADETINKLHEEKRKVEGRLAELEKDKTQLVQSFEKQLVINEKIEREKRVVDHECVLLQERLCELQNAKDELDRVSKEAEASLALVEAEQIDLTQQLQEAKKRASSLEQSNSYRLGRTVSAPYRWIKRAIKKTSFQVLKMREAPKALPDKEKATSNAKAESNRSVSSWVAGKDEKEGSHSKPISSVLIYDVALETDNLGDEIIMQYANKVIQELFPQSTAFHVPTHRVPSLSEYEVIQKSDISLVCGTNMLCPNVDQYNLWRMPDIGVMNDLIVFMAIGANSYGDFTETSSDLYRAISNKQYRQSARDRYTSCKMDEMQIPNLYTGCVTMWGLTSEVCATIPRKKADQVITTITAHRDKSYLEQFYRDILDSYDTVYFWPQGDRDLEVFNALSIERDKVIVVPRTLADFESVLRSNQGAIDYVGSRLHGGIHALNHGVRTIVVEVDNRAIEIAKDTNIPSINSKEIAGLKELIHSELEFNIAMPWDAINEWKSQFR